MEQTAWIVQCGKSQLGVGTVAVCRAAAFPGPVVGVWGWLWKNQPPQSLHRAFGCISIIDSINYAHCCTPPWERLSIQANVFKSVRCSRSRRFLLPLNGREQRYCVESHRLREIASEPEELLLFHTKLPMVRAAFPVWGDTKVGEKLHAPGSYHSHQHQMFQQLKEHEDGTELPVWQMLAHECSLSLSFILLPSFSLIISRNWKGAPSLHLSLGKPVFLSSPARKRKDLAQHYLVFFLI